MPIKIEKLFYDYNRNTPFAAHALVDVSIEIEDHCFLALVGETGSGKSTLVQHLNGLLWPSSGKIHIADHLIDGDDPKLQKKKKKGVKDLRAKVGLVFQFPEYQLFEVNVLKDVAFGPKNFGHSEEEALAIAKESLTLVGLDETYYDRPPFELSGGEKRRAAIAGIIALKPSVLVLDEPTAGLDPKGEKEMMELFLKIHDAGTSIILVTHNMDIVLKYATKVAVMNKGQLVRHTCPLDLFQDLELLRKTAIEPPFVFKVATELIANGLDLDITKISDVSTLAKEIKRSGVK